MWLTREPLPAQAWEPRTWHRYQYAYASPISYYDPYGMQVPLVTLVPVPTSPPYTLVPRPTPTPGPSPTPTLTPAPQPRPTPPWTPTPTPTGAQCSPQPPLSEWWSEHRQQIANILSKTALTLDAIAFLLSGVEAAITDISAVILIGEFAAAGASAEGVGAIPGAILGLKIALALDVAIASYSSLGWAENILGWAAAGATFISDIAAGYAGFPEGGGLAIGQDTLVSVRNALLGYIPESNIDLAISASQLRYDIERNFMGRPGGSVVFTSPTDWEAWKRTFQVLLKEW